MTLKISNRDARRLWLEAQDLSAAPTGAPDILATIKKLGFVQLDTIQLVARAHHHILWSRNQNYRERMLNTLLVQDRSVFEHFTHDASVLPMEFYPLWRRQFQRLATKILREGWYSDMPDKSGREAIKTRIALEGPLSTRDFDTKIASKPGMWKRPPHKLALDFMWYAGELSTSHRENFTKFYDLTERVIPSALLEDERADGEQTDWLCRAALDRLAFGTEGDIQRFWAAMDLCDVKDWTCRAGVNAVPVQIESSDGEWTAALAPPDIENRLTRLPPLSSRLRILNPFDPAVRDRRRLFRLFGFDYTNEMFVPAARRRWGYYIYPLLERDRFVGRIELKANRKAGSLSVLRLWAEPGVKWAGKRRKKLDSELARLARFVNVQDIIRLDKPL